MPLATRLGVFAMGSCRFFGDSPASLRGQPGFRLHLGFVSETCEAVGVTLYDDLPVIEGHPGFRGFYAFRDERKPGHAVSVSLWRDRATALSAHKRVLVAMEALRGVFLTRPTMTVGAARITATP